MKQTKNYSHSQYCNYPVYHIYHPDTTVVNIHHQMDFATHCRPHANEILILGWGLYTVEDETTKAFYDQLVSIPEITHRTMSAITQNCTYGLDNMYVDCADADLSFFDFYDIQLWKEDFSPQGNKDYMKSRERDFSKKTRDNRAFR